MNFRKTLTTPQARRCSAAAVASAAAALMLAPGAAFASGHPAGPERPPSVGHASGAADTETDGSSAGHSASGHAGHAGHSNGKKSTHKKGQSSHPTTQHTGGHATSHTAGHGSAHGTGHGAGHTADHGSVHGTGHATGHGAGHGTGHATGHAPGSATAGTHHHQGVMHRAVGESDTGTDTGPGHQPPKSSTPKAPKPGNQKSPSDHKKSPESGPMATVTKLSMSKNLTSTRAVTMSAHVTLAHRTPGAPPETGTIDFSVDGSSSGPVPVANHRASVKVKLTPGKHTATAKYSGDSTHSPSDSGPTTFTVS